MTQIIDLSAPIVGSGPDVPVFQRNQIEYFDHAAGAAEIQELFGVPARLLRAGEGWTREVVTTARRSTPTTFNLPWTTSRMPLCPGTSF